MGGTLIKAFYNYFLETHPSEQILKSFYLFDTSLEKKSEYKRNGFNFTETEKEVFDNANIIFLCVKPDLIQGLIERNLNSILENNNNYNTGKKVIISIAAGISISFMENIFKSVKAKIPKIIRIMSNHLCSIKQASSVYCLNSECQAEDEHMLNAMLKNVGIIKKVSENQINAFTALAGSGPAFVYYFIESLIDASILNGIDFNTARDYAIQTVMAAAKFLKDENEKNPSNVKYVVTTPNGTTIAGLAALERNKFKHAVMQAISQATKRGRKIENDKMKIFAKAKF